MRNLFVDFNENFFVDFGRKICFGGFCERLTFVKVEKGCLPFAALVPLVAFDGCG